MKIIKTIMFLVLLTGTLNVATARKIQFTYDDAGNRIKRELVTIQEVNKQDKKLQKFLNGNSLDKEITVVTDMSSNIIHVNAKGLTLQEEYKIAMYSIAGYMVLESQLPTSGYTDLDISQLPKGVYVLVVTNGTESKAWKITKAE